MEEKKKEKQNAFEDTDKDAIFENEETTLSTKETCDSNEANTEDEKATESKKPETIIEDEDSLKKAQEQVSEYKSLYLRKAADFENYRKRMIREKSEAGDYATSKLILDILPILDNFDRAIEAEVEKNNESIKAFVDGVIMIKTQLESLLSKDYGLSYYASKGEVFDPNIHEAVAKQPSTEVEVETVGAEIQKGYKLKDKVLRHAKVLVLMPEKPSEE